MRLLAIAVAATCATACRSKSIVERYRDEPDVDVVVTMPGAAASALEPDAMLVESSLIGLPGFSRIETQITQGRIVASAAVSSDVDRLTAVQRAHEGITRIAAQLSDSASFPTVRWRGHRRVVLRYVIRSDAARADVVRWSNVPREAASNVNDVVDVETCGTGDPMLELDVDLARASALGIASSEILDVVDDLSVLRGQPSDPGELRVGRARISDIAATVHTWRPADCESGTARGASIVGTVYADGRADMVAVRDALEQRLRGLAAGPGATLDILPRVQPIKLELDAPNDKFYDVLPDIGKRLRPVTEIEDFVALRDAATSPITVYLVPAGGENASDVEQAARTALAGRFKILPPNPLEVRLYGPDLDADLKARADLAAQLGDHVVGRRGGDEDQVTRIVPDRDAAARLGATISDIMRVYAALAKPGSRGASPTDSGEVIYVHLGGDLSLATVRARSVPVPLSQVSHLDHGLEPSEILRENAVRYVALLTDASEAELRKALAAVKLPPGMFTKVISVEH